jgi:hypothetical protein
VTAPDTTADRRLEALRWRISAEWALPLELVSGDTQAEMLASAASHRPDWVREALGGARRG